MDLQTTSKKSAQTLKGYERPTKSFANGTAGFQIGEWEVLVILETNF